MRKRWIILLSLIGAFLFSGILYFCAKQLKNHEYKPRFYLSGENGKKGDLESKEMANMKRQLLTSVSKNSKNHLKGTVPKNLVFDISKTKDDGTSGYMKIISETYVQIPGFKGFTHVLKTKSKVSLYKFRDFEQNGLPSGKEFEAFLTFFKEDELDGLPYVVCPVSSIDTMSYECYLRNPNDDWTRNDSLSEIDVTDSEFGEKASKIVYDHYLSDSSSFGDTESTNYDVESAINDLESAINDLESYIGSEDSSANSFDDKVYDNFEFDISRTDDGTSGPVRTIGGTYVQIPKFKGFTHVIKGKSKVSTYRFHDCEQNGLPTGEHFEAFLTFFKEDNLDHLPYVVCPVTSIDTMSYECYLRNPNDSWSKNESLSEIDIMDAEFGEKASSIVCQHYDIEN
ncbi:putative integral membrane protein [Theileria parva strain Muguga]|uniref:Uncharacterized protein n=1 Tax=Theileria parva TaxID=5875 RepID=Q4MYJ1_THEPA|nr:putative integral membrane protein [Theileria parva strain Muguga]EAN30691.1 putative integral membrane protein [Theileria parva strain Muguga]|eukprot:XP_762974.1 hypothetical protein [Theileria parva strain Muguga]